MAQPQPRLLAAAVAIGNVTEAFPSLITAEIEQEVVGIEQAAMNGANSTSAALLQPGAGVNSSLFQLMGSDTSVVVSPTETMPVSTSISVVVILSLALGAATCVAALVATMRMVRVRRPRGQREPAQQGLMEKSFSDEMAAGSRPAIELGA
jgi:hypothetical protein